MDGSPASVSTEDTDPDDATGGETLLIVDDDRAIREMLSYKLEEMYDVITRENGEDCLRFLEGQPPQEWPDLILLDVMMPGRDGIKILQDIRETVGSNDMGIIVISGSGQEDTATDAFDAGADDFIMKPISLDELSARIRRLLA